MICPVCNALIPLEVTCPNCGSAAEDEGRWSDWSGPYSPYETAGFTLLDEVGPAGDSVCRHAVRCICCQQPFSADITAWHV